MTSARRLSALLILLLLAACGSSPPRSRPVQHGGSTAGTSSSGRWSDDTNKPQHSRYHDADDSVPSGPPPDLSKLVEPVPKVEPRSLYGNKSPYSVLGQSYTVLPTAHGYVERGIASFYGNKFHKYKTSNLEDYDMYQFSAAHKTLPLPSFARVTNLQNGKSVVVRINDRGPFMQNRLIDLSYAAAVKIGIWPRGTGLVEVRAIDPGEPLQELPPAQDVKAAGQVGPGIYLQVGAFSDMANADRVADRLRQANFAPVQVVDIQVGGHSVRRVRVGPLADVERADEVTDKIENMGLPRPQVAVD